MVSSEDCTLDPSMKQLHHIALSLIILAFPDLAFPQTPLVYGFRNKCCTRSHTTQHAYRTVPNLFRHSLNAKHDEILGVPESRGDSFEGPRGRNISQLLHKTGILSKVAPGIYADLPVGQKIMSRLERVVRVEMARLGAHEISLPILQPEGIMISRLSEFGSDLYKVVDRHRQLLHLSPTCEEHLCLVVRSELSPLSKSRLPIRLYQIKTKFRDEIRPSDAGMRCREFTMKDAYSFHADTDSAFAAYVDFKECYKRIMDMLQISYNVYENITEAGSDEEFRVLIDNHGEELTEMEIAHLFQLGTSITTEAGLMYEDSGREEKPVYLNSYGIGLHRLLYAAISQHCDGDGLRVPQLMAPYDVAIVPCEHGGAESVKLANDLQLMLGRRGLHSMLDNRDIPVKHRTNDLRTIGVPHIVYVSCSLDGAERHAPSTELAEGIKSCAVTSNSYHLWQSETSIIARNTTSTHEDISGKMVRYVWRAADGEYVLPVSDLLDLLSV